MSGPEVRQGRGGVGASVRPAALPRGAGAGDQPGAFGAGANVPAAVPAVPRRGVRSQRECVRAHSLPRPFPGEFTVTF